MDNRPILLVCGCRAHESYLHAALRRFANDAWHLVGFMGDPAVAAPQFDEASRILTLPVPDTYETLPQKVHAAISWALEKWPNAPCIFKTDDDILVSDLQELVAAINLHVSAETPYWGVVTHRCHAAYVPVARIKGRFTDMTKKPKHQAANYCFGHGYGLSAAAARVAVAAATDYATSYLEDVCTGFVMNRAGWIPVHVPIRYREMPRVPELLKYCSPPT
jgi:hypothetical protein